ncbi:MAG: sugar MFS transporter [Bacteroidota bacterium]|nr:sugar MFS transporter [Bacteroidota bacterium]
MQQNSRERMLPILILGALFFLFGFVTWLNGTLIPYLKIACELTNFQSLFVAFAFYIAYFITALPSAWLLERTGLKKGMMIGLFVMAAGALLFVPAAIMRTYWMFLTGLFIIGTGLSILQTASNPYITIVGPMESAAKRISIMGICNKVAGVLAPLVLGAIVLGDADTFVASIEGIDPALKEIRLDELASRVVLPYIVMCIVLIILGIFIRLSPLPDIEAEGEQHHDPKRSEDNGVLSYPHLVLGVIALFLYVGAEVIAGDTIGNYGRSQGIPLSEAKHLTSYTLAAMVIGYIIGILTIPRIISQSKALMLSAITGIVITLIAITTDGYASVLCIALLGFANALVWPAIWPLAIAGLGSHTKTGSAMLIMAIAGGALLPLVYGRLADAASIGPQNAYWILVPCYLFILWYSIKGSRIRSW